MANVSQDYYAFLLFKEVPWMIVYICEAVLILTGNFTTMYIFWNIRKRLKRTRYLLINLAVADIFVGIGLSFYIVHDIANMLEKAVIYNLGYASKMIDIIATVSSLLSLALISLERMFAILWPFRHRLLQTRYFYVSVGFIWLFSGANVASNLRFGSELSDGFSYSIFTGVTYVASVIIITGAYLAIWNSTRHNKVLTENDRRSMTQNRNLAKSLFIMTALSVITCLPSGIMIVFNLYNFENFFSFKMQITLVTQYANSFLNPIVYCFRMPEFKTSLKKLLCRCSRNRLSFDENSQGAINGVTLRSMKSLEIV